MLPFQRVFMLMSRHIHEPTEPPLKPTTLQRPTRSTSCCQMSASCC